MAQEYGKKPGSTAVDPDAVALVSDIKKQPGGEQKIT